MILAELASCLDDKPSLLRSFHETFRYDVIPALNDFLRSLFCTMPERTAAFRSVSSSQIETQSEPWRQRASSTKYSRYQRMLSSAAVFHSASTTSKALGPGSPWSK